MKTLENKKIKVKDESTDYKELISEAINNAPPGGLSFDDIRNRLKIQTVIDKSNGKMEFEDAVAENLKDIVKESRWMVVDKSLGEFADAIEAL